MKKICILGSTGSIGTQALEVIENHKDLFKVSVLSCGTRIEELSAQIIKYKPEIAVVGKVEDAVSKALDRVFLGDQTVDEAFAQAQSEAQAALDGK